METWERIAKWMKDCHGALKTGHLWAAQKRPVVGG